MAITATNVVRKTENYSVGGGWFETGTFLLTPQPIVANSQGTEFAAIPTADVGDQVFISSDCLPAMAILSGAVVSSDGVVEICFSNAYAATTLNIPETKFNYLIVHLSENS